MACNTSSWDYLVTSLASSLISAGPKLEELLGVGEDVLLGLIFFPFFWYVSGSESLPEAAYSSSMSMAASKAAFRDSYVVAFSISLRVPLESPEMNHVIVCVGGVHLGTSALFG